MAVDGELPAAARAAHERLVESERAAGLARAEFRDSVRKPHLAGASLREAGEALNVGHQRVHQLVQEAGGEPGWRGWRSLAGVGGRSPGQACSFCGKPRESAGKLIAGPGGVAICDACAGKAGQVLATGKVAATPLSSIKPVPRPAGAEGPAAAGAVVKCCSD